MPAEPHVDVIRLVGGPPKLDGSLCDLRTSEGDRADADGTRFVRAVHGSTVTALATLQSRCTDRVRTAELAGTWRAAVYRSNRSRRRAGRRPAVYRFDGQYALEPRRDRAGRWRLGVAGRLHGGPLATPPSPETVWVGMEATVDAAAARFATVAALLPDGFLGARVDEAQITVERWVADALRLAAVGQTVDPDGIGPTASSLITRLGALVASIDDATAQLIDLHLHLTDPADRVTTVHALGQVWAELGTTEHGTVPPC